MPYSHYNRVGGPPKGYTQGIVDAVFRLGIGNRVWGLALREWGLGVGRSSPPGLHDSVRQVLGFGIAAYALPC